MKEIESMSDVEVLVDSFYQRVLSDPTIGFIFTDIVALSWQEHIPVMYSFWGSVLLGTNTYHDNPMVKHIQLDKKIHLTEEHFAKWLFLWEETVNTHFNGHRAEEAIKRAKNIAALMQFKIQQNRRTQTP